MAVEAAVRLGVAVGVEVTVGVSTFSFSAVSPFFEGGEVREEGRVGETVAVGGRRGETVDGWCCSETLGLLTVVREVAVALLGDAEDETGKEEEV